VGGGYSKKTRVKCFIMCLKELQLTVSRHMDQQDESEMSLPATDPLKGRKKEVQSDAKHLLGGAG